MCEKCKEKKMNCDNLKQWKFRKIVDFFFFAFIEFQYFNDFLKIRLHIRKLFNIPVNIQLIFEWLRSTTMNKSRARFMSVELICWFDKV